MSMSSKPKTNMQQLQLSGSDSLALIQERFQSVFPDLRINFFHHAHGRGAASHHDDLVKPGSLLREIRSMDKDGVWEFKPEMSVQEFEQGLETDFGLHVQVFRRSGNQWIMATMTDHWTLEKQQGEGKASLKYKD